jgi:choline-glycine betaine transporter
LVVLALVVAGVLNLEEIFSHTIFLWARVSIPASLLIGAFGLAQPSRILSVIAAVVGWMGLALFFLVVVLTLIPSEWARVTLGPRAPSEYFLVVRFLFLMSLGIGIAVLFAKFTTLARARMPV